MNDSANNTKVDMAHLARLAGVSVSTVSRALADSPRVKPATKNKIKGLADQHNFHPNEAARSWRLKRTGIINVVLSSEDDHEHQFSDPFSLQMIGNVANALQGGHYDMLLSHHAFSSAENYLKSRASRFADGAIFIGQGHISSELNVIERSGLPIVVWGAPVPDRLYPIVGSDNVEGGYLATQHLLSRGAKRVAFFGEEDLPEARARLDGYKKALRNAGIDIDPELLAKVSFEPKKAEVQMKNFFRLGVQFDAIFCSSDVIAMTAYGIIRERRIVVGSADHVPIVGYDNIFQAATNHPKLTSICQNIPSGSQILVQKLIAKLNGESVGDTLIPPQLIIRESA